MQTLTASRRTGFLCHPGELPAHAVLLDPSQCTIVLAFRGTKKKTEVLRDMCGVPKAQPCLPGAAFAHTGIAAYVDTLCSEEYFEVVCSKLTLGGSPLFPTKRAAASGHHAQGILALIQRLVTLSAEGSFEGWGGGRRSGPPDSRPLAATKYAGWRAVFVGHSLGGGVAALLHARALCTISWPGIAGGQQLLPFTGGAGGGQAPPLAHQLGAAPLYAICYGSPPTLSHELAALSALSCGQLDALSGRAAVVRSTGTAEQPAWWPNAPSRPWTPTLSLCTTLVHAEDLIPRLSMHNLKRFIARASEPGVSLLVKLHAAKQLCQAVRKATLEVAKALPGALKRSWSIASSALSSYTGLGGSSEGGGSSSSSSSNNSGGVPSASGARSRAHLRSVGGGGGRGAGAQPLAAGGGKCPPGGGTNPPPPLLTLHPSSTSPSKFLDAWRREAWHSAEPQSSGNFNGDGDSAGGCCIRATGEQEEGRTELCLAGAIVHLQVGLACHAGALQKNFLALCPTNNWMEHHSIAHYREKVMHALRAGEGGDLG